jgi:hypothetical protein
VYSKDETESPTLITLQAQTLCTFVISPSKISFAVNDFIPLSLYIGIVWSSQPDFGIAPAPFLDASLLVTGNRAGTLSLFR